MKTIRKLNKEISLSHSLPFVSIYLKRIYTTPSHHTQNVQQKTFMVISCTNRLIKQHVKGWVRVNGERECKSWRY